MLQKVRGKLMIIPKTLAPGWSQMYRHNEEQLEFEDFHLPFGGRLLFSLRAHPQASSGYGTENTISWRRGSRHAKVP